MVYRSNFLPFRDLTGLNQVLNIFDIGYGAPEAEPPYAPLLTDAGSSAGRIALSASSGTSGAYHFGDGGPALMHVCRDPASSSLLAPDPEVCGRVGDLGDGAVVVARHSVPTRRLDDVPESLGLDLLVLDVRGAELDVLRHGVERLRDAAVLQVTVGFLPLRRGQALFGDVDLFMRAQGFILHRFARQDGQVLHAAGIGPERGLGPSQLLAADAVYIPDLTRLGRCPARKLIATAAILHDSYGSVDVVLRLLVELDKRSGTNVAAAYLAGLQGRPVAKAA